MKYIEKKSVVELPPASGSISDTTNITDKVTNAYSARLVEEKLNSKQNTLTAGDNISIVNNVISSTGGANLDPVARVGSDAANSAGWYKVADSTMTGWYNANITFLIKEGYRTNHVGILNLEMRSNNTSIECWMCKWLVRSGFASNCIRIVISGMKWTMYYKVTSAQYGRAYFIELQHRNINGEAPYESCKVNYYNTTTKETTDPTATVTSSDGGTVNYANSAGTATKATQDADGRNIASSYLRRSEDYLNTHPENKGTILPFINNDIAFFTERGGTVKVYYDGVEQNINTANMFDASPSYWAINPQSANLTTLVIELTLFKGFGWTNTIYVDSGSSGWRAKNVKIEVMNSNYADDVWTVKYDKTNLSTGQNFVSFNHTPVGTSSAGNGFNKVRFTFSGWANATIFRIAQIGLVNYGSAGLRETNMSRGIDDAVYRNITPNTTDKYSLGSSSKRWFGHFKNLTLYGAAAEKPLVTRAISGSDGNGNDGPLYLNYGINQAVFLGSNGSHAISADGGDYSGNSATATKLQTARTINGVSFDGSANITITATDNNAIPKTQKGVANGVADLDANGLIPSSRLPSYVDDILEYSAKSGFPTTGETGKIYVDTSTNLTYRWSGSAYVEISPSLALGTTSSTAFRGDYGNTAYTHANAKGSAFGSGFYKITTNAQGHVTAATAVTKSDITGLGIPAQDTTYSVATTSANGLMSSTDKTKLDGIASIIPTNFGEIKTKYRIANKANAGSANWYYPLCSFPKTSDGNYASAIISGRIGGWVDNNMSYINALIWNRGSVGISLLDIAGSATSMSSIWNTCDIAVYTDDTTGICTVFLKCKSYFTFDLNLEMFQSSNSILYDGTYLTETPSGTLGALASTSNKRVEIINGKALVNGKELATNSVATTSANGIMSSTDKSKMDNTNVAWGTCSTAAATAAKEITITGNTNWVLKAGSIIGVKFTNTNTAQNPTFNVNGTGAKSVWYNTSAITTGSLSYAGVANRPMYYMFDGTYFVALGWSIESNDNNIPSAYCSTAAATAAKVASCSGYALLSNSYIQVIMTQTNTSAGALTLNINSKGAKPIYINGSASSASNYTLPAGSYFVFYNGTNYYFRTDGKITGNITGNAGTATKLATARTISLTGDVTGSTSFDGSGNVSISCTIDGAGSLSAKATSITCTLPDNL